jgi:hypothetical protein
MIKSKVEVISKETLISDLRKSFVKSVTVIDPTADDNITAKSQIDRAARSNKPYTVIILQ